MKRKRTREKIIFSIVGFKVKVVNPAWSTRIILLMSLIVFVVLAVLILLHMLKSV